MPRSRDDHASRQRSKLPSPTVKQGRGAVTERSEVGNGRSTDPLTPVLTANWAQTGAWTLKAYVDQGGYNALQGCVELDPDEIVTMVKDSGLRGRGGAGFPTGMKWGFLPPLADKPRYLVVNADESEPGACKDIPLMLASPHTLVEGVIISSLRDPRAQRVHLRTWRGTPRRPPAAAGGCAGVRSRLHRHRPPRYRVRPRRHRARRRGRLHLR